MFLIVSRDGSQVQVLPLGEGRIAVGREVGADLRLDDRAIAPRQVEIEVAQGQATVSAVAGTPGFTIGGRPVPAVQLTEGDEVHVGPFSLRVQRDVDGGQGPFAAEDAHDDEEAIDSAIGFALGQLFDEEEHREPRGLALELDPGVDPDEERAQAPAWHTLDDLDPEVRRPAVPPPLGVAPVLAESRPAVAESPTLGAGPCVVLAQEERSFSLGQGTLFIGSGEGMGIVVHRPGVARRHAAVQWVEGGYVLRDLGGAGDVTIRGREVSSWRLKHGDVWQIGPVSMQLHWPGQPEAEARRAGPIVEATPEDTDEPPAEAKGRRLVGAAAALLLLGAVGLGVALRDELGALIGSPPPPPPLAVEAIAPGELAARGPVEVLLAAGRTPGAAEILAPWARGSVEAGPLARHLLGWTTESQVGDLLERALVEALAAQPGKAARAAQWTAEGAALMRRAERAFADGASAERVQRLAGEARAAYKAAQRFAPADEAIKDGLTAAARLAGLARMREDDQRQRLEREAPELLVQSARLAFDGGQLVQAAWMVEAAQRRAGESPAGVGEAAALQAEIRARQQAALAPLLAAADAAEATSRRVDARVLVEAAVEIDPLDTALRARWERLFEAGRVEADAAFERGREQERRGRRADAQESYRQVLEHVPERSEPLHQRARARLEELADASL